MLGSSSPQHRASAGSGCRGLSISGEGDVSCPLSTARAFTSYRATANSCTSSEGRASASYNSGASSRIRASSSSTPRDRGSSRHLCAGSSTAPASALQPGPAPKPFAWPQASDRSRGRASCSTTSRARAGTRHKAMADSTTRTRIRGPLELQPSQTCTSSCTSFSTTARVPASSRAKSNQEPALAPYPELAPALTLFPGQRLATATQLEAVPERQSPGQNQFVSNIPVSARTEPAPPPELEPALVPAPAPTPGGATQGGASDHTAAAQLRGVLGSWAGAFLRSPEVFSGFAKAMKI